MGAEVRRGEEEGLDRHLTEWGQLDTILFPGNLMPLVTLVAGTLAILSPQPDTTGSGKPSSPLEPQIIYLNPVHLLQGNITIGFERFVGRRTTFKTTLSGGTDPAYVFASVGGNRHVGWHSPVSYFAGLSVFGYESPIETRVPISSPVNEFFESKQDRYFAGLYATNGVLFRVWRRVFVTVDAAAGPARDFTGKRWLATWSINLNLGFPF